MTTEQKKAREREELLARMRHAFPRKSEHELLEMLNADCANWEEQRAKLSDELRRAESLEQPSQLRKQSSEP